VAGKDEYWQVRATAVGKLTDPLLLAAIAAQDASHEVRQRAMTRAAELPPTK